MLAVAYLAAAATPRSRISFDLTSVRRDETVLFEFPPGGTVEQLSGLDATFLNLETPRSPLHIGGLAIYDQSSAPEGLVTLKGILKNIESRLHLARCFRQKLAVVPFGLDHLRDTLRGLGPRGSVSIPHPVSACRGWPRP